ncbi:MAG: glutathione S-transferase C-terminal domain-containing protein [Pseudomonadota bacterium]
MSNTKNNPSVEEDQTAAASRRVKGEFVRGISGFRHAIGDPDFPPQRDRYHLFVALNCPWCHRTTLARNILGLQDSVSLDVAFPNRTGEEDPVAPNLWMFDPGRVASLTDAALPECTHETGTGNNLRLAKEIYALESSDEQSLPVLYDKVSKRIVSNESAEIIRMLSAHADALGSVIPAHLRPDLYPAGAALRSEIDSLNALIYVSINNGAYKAGFSSDQEIYAQAFLSYFDTLEMLNARLSSDGRPFLCGDMFTEADLRLFPTLYRHDPVYFVRMKLNGARILDYPDLWRWLCRVYALPGVAESNSIVHCRQGYFGRSWNKVVPLGPIKPFSYPEAYKHPELEDANKTGSD